MNHPTGTVTFLFTDIEGSTKLAQEHPETWEILRERHDAILQAAIETYNGYVFKTIGDAFCAAFSTAGDALLATLKAQVDLSAENWGETPVKARMGLHTGKAEIQANGDYNGYATLSRTQRLMSAGHGGQALISQATQELVRAELPPGVTLRDMGERRLKDLIHPEHIYQVNSPNLPTEFPALKTLDVQSNNLPAQMTPFIGREREIAAVLGLLRNPNVRLVTLTGAGGTGKTRLSLQVAADLLDEYEHGVWFVELAPITEPGLVLPTIASVLKVKESADAPIEQALHEYLSKRNLLLVIDNFEQVVSAAPGIGKLLAAAPKVKVLTSSREVLRLRGEHDYPVPPLGLPESRRRQTAAVLAQYEAIALFVQHARAANSAFELNEENALIVAEICMKLDGLPLAIELAAARSKLLKPAVILEKLKSRLDVLVSKTRDLPQRQQTIRGAIDWSYELLEEAEQVLFARLGVFVGGWTIEAADAVCGDGLAINVLGGLEALLDKSLLRQFEGVSGETRFTMLETIREYAFEKLTQSDELLTIQQAHANEISALLEKVNTAMNGPEETSWFEKLDDELENLRAAVAWALAHEQPGLVFKGGSLYDYWFRRRLNFHEPLSWLERALAMPVSVPNYIPSERAWALNITGILKLETDEIQSAASYFESSLALFREIGDRGGISECLKNLGNVEFKQKNFEQARQLYEQSLAVVEVETFYTTIILNNLGRLEQMRGNWQAARDYYLRSREICKRLGAEAGVSYTDMYLGRLAWEQQEMMQAQGYFESALKSNWVQQNPLYKGSLCGVLGYLYVLFDNKKDAKRRLSQALEAAVESLNQDLALLISCFIFEGKAYLELSDGRAKRAAQLFGASKTRREQEAYPLTEFERPDYEAAIAETRSAIGDTAFDETFAKGQAMTLEEAIAFALQESDE